MGIVEQYLLQLKNEKRRWRRTVAILTVLSLFVAVGVAWNLRMTGITIANGSTCGCEEHLHSEECPFENVLICGYPEETEITESAEGEEAAAETESPLEEEEQAVSETEPQHVHSEECYETVSLCEIEEHTHDFTCYSDETADLENSAVWEATIPELTGNWAEDFVLVAKSQLGSGESERNYVIDEDGETRKGITRYGQWYGNPYGEWSSMFMMFCIKYAEIPEDVIPQSPGVYNAMRLAQEAGIFIQPDENMNKAGNILFIDTDENGNADRMAVTTAYEDEEISAIGGDFENKVAEIFLSPDDPKVLGYIDIEKLHEDWKAANEPPEDKEEEPAEEKEIILDLEFTDDGKIRLTAEIEDEEDMYLWQWQYSEDGNEPWTDIEGATELVLELEDTEENYQRYYRIQGHKIEMVPMMMSYRAAEPEPEPEEESEPEDDGIITSEPIAPFSIGKNNNNYTIDVYAVPVDSDGNIMGEIQSLGQFTVNSTSKITAKSKFNNELGEYQSAYFGKNNGTNVTVDDIQSVWRTESGNWRKTYYLAYQQTNGTSKTQWLQNADNSISLYLRYIPNYVMVTFKSEGFESVTEKVDRNGNLTVTEQNGWTKEGYTLVGWTIEGDEQNVYTYEELLTLTITKNTVFNAKWLPDVHVSFNLGEYTQSLYSVEPIRVPYGTSVQVLPNPIWKNNIVSMAFDGWYLNQELTEKVTSDYVFLGDTILYAKWVPNDDGYYVYFMDFEREGQTVPLVLVTYSVSEGQTASAYVPGNLPEGTQWDGKWYLDEDHTVAYNFAIPVSRMTEYLTGAYNRDLYLYPGTEDVCRAIFVTYGTRIDPITLVRGESINLDLYVPERNGYEFAGWTLQDGTPVSGMQTLTETTTFYANWNASYVPFEAILRIENANDTNMTQADILGTWYAKAGSNIVVKSTYSGSGTSRKGTHEVVCVINGEEYPVYKNSALTQKATLNDVYSTYFIYNNTGTNWTDEVNWDDVFIGGEVPYSTKPVSSSGDTIINFDYMRVRRDIVFTIPNTESGGFIDVYKLQQNGLITGSVTYSGTKPTTTGQNVSASGVSAQNISWSYTAASSIADTAKNYYTLHDMKYGQRIFEVYPVGGSWLTPRGAGYHQYNVNNGKQFFSSRRQDLTSDFFSGSGRELSPYSLVVEFKDQEYIALMYAIECLEGEEPDFTLNGVGYKVDTELLEVVKHTGDYSIKELDGCEPGISANGTYKNSQNGTSNKYYSAKINRDTTSATVMKNAKVGDTSVYTLFAEKFWPYYSKFTGVESVTTFSRAYIFYYNRIHMNIQFNLGYDADGDGSNDIVKYEGIAYGERIDEYQFGMPDYETHPLLSRNGYEFAGWLDHNGFVLDAEDWDSLVATGDSENNTMIFIAKWEKISNNMVEYYEDRSAEKPFETHYFDDAELVPYPTTSVYPEGWVWQIYGEGQFERFDWDVPMYGEYGVREIREINGEETVVNVIRIYGTWDDSHTKVIYDPNAPQGGVPGTAPEDLNEYTIWQSEVPVASRGDTENSDPDKIFVGWKLDRNGIVYHGGDHVPVHWPRVMVFVAQWTDKEDVVYLRYDPNGGTPENMYPNESGFPYMKNATAAVWNNILTNNEPYFTRAGYTFIGWNTEPDGSGKTYAPDSTIVLTEPITTLYAQWEHNHFTVSLTKVDSETNKPLIGAEFGLYKYSGGTYLSVQSLTTAVDGQINFTNLEMDTLYKLVEEKPPNGYAIITREIFFRIVPEDNRVSLVFYDSEGREISVPQGISGEYIAGNKILTLTVKNLRGYELPSTGGLGIYPYIFCGLAIILAPLIYGFSSRRKCERRSQ